MAFRRAINYSPLNYLIENNTSSIENNTNTSQYTPNTTNVILNGLWRYACMLHIKTAIPRRRVGLPLVCVCACVHVRVCVCAQACRACVCAYITAGVCGMLSHACGSMCRRCGLWSRWVVLMCYSCVLCYW